MQLKVYCHEWILKIFRKYSSYDDCVNRIIDDAMSEKFDYMDCPQCPPRENGAYIYVNVRNDAYLQLLALYGAKSPKISLRRIIYYYMDMEMYYDWEPSVANEERIEIERRLGNALDSVRRLRNCLFGSKQREVDEMLSRLYAMSKEIAYEYVGGKDDE